MHLTSHIIAHMAMPPYIAHYRSNWFRFRFWLFGNNPPNAHRSQIKMCEKRQTRNVQFRFMQNAFRILKPIQKNSKCVSVFRNTGANAFAKNQMRLAYEDKRDLYCTCGVYCQDWAQLMWFLLDSKAAILNLELTKSHRDFSLLSLDSSST